MEVSVAKTPIKHGWKWRQKFSRPRGYNGLKRYEAIYSIFGYLQSKLCILETNKAFTFNIET